MKTMIFVALLRGINVGGNNKVDMKQLKGVFEDLGLKNVKTYINSGNIIFEDTSHTPKKLVTLLEKAIEKNFGFAVKVLIRDINSIKKIHKALPNSWVNDDTMKCDVMFLWESVDSKKVLDDVVIKENIDDVKYVAGAILWRLDRKNAGKSGIMKLIGTKLYKQMTIRNCNTLRKLVTLMEGMHV